MSVLPAPDLVSVQPLLALVAQPVTVSPAPLSKAAMLSPASSFFRSVLSIISSLFNVNDISAFSSRTENSRIRSQGSIVISQLQQESIHHN